MSFLESSFYGNTLQAWSVALAVAVVTLLVLRLVLSVAVRRIGKVAQQAEANWADLVTGLLRGTKLFFVLLLAAVAGSQVLDLPQRGRDVLTSLAVIAFLIQAGLWGAAATTVIIQRYQARRLQEDAGAATMVGALSFLVKLLVWAIVLLLSLDNLGVDITALVAGLGVGGIAVALAVQNVLGDLFASLAIVLDRPFVIGDFLIIDDFLGSVEHVGLKTTRLRSLSGEQLIFSNADLLGSRVRNYGRMTQRRVVFSLGVTYQTPRTKLEAIPSIIRDAVESQEQARFDRSHFKAYGGFSIDFETVYYVLAADYNLYMDIQQAINLHIHRQFEEQGIEFAYPTQTLFVSRQES